MLGRLPFVLAFFYSCLLSTFNSLLYVLYNISVCLEYFSVFCLSGTGFIVNETLCLNEISYLTEK